MTRSATCQPPEHRTKYTYDANGNLIGDGRRCFAYDDENQLSSVWVTNAWRSDFVYDGKMRRRIRREYSWLSGIGNWQLAKEVRYVYDGNLVIQERDANNLPLVTYTRGRDLSGTLEGAGGIGGLLARTDNRQWTIGDSSAHACYHADGNGNVTCLINTNQVIVAYYLYDPYGNILSQSGSLAEANTYRFSSKEFHVASGLVYYLYRCYEPTLQRWMNRDPISERGFYYSVLPQFEYLHGWTRDYIFVINSPLSQHDARGLYHVCCRLVEYKEGDGCLVWAASKFIYHCDMRPSRTPCDSPNDSSYPVVSDRPSNGTLPDGTSCCKATGQQISSCLKNQRTDAGHGRWGDNCQSSTMNNLKTCCAKSTWSPSPYAYPYNFSFPDMVN